VVKKIRDILPSVSSTYTYQGQTYFAYNQQALKELATDDQKRHLYLVLVRCILRFLSPSCYQNKLWNLAQENGVEVTRFVLMFPQMCCNELKNHQDVFVMLELCFQVIALVCVNDFHIMMYL